MPRGTRDAALLLPGVARRFPFSAPLRTRREGLISPRGLAKWGDCQMTIKANGRSALILAAGLLVCFAGPSQAATGADNADREFEIGEAAGAPVALNKYTKHGSHHAESYAHHRSSKVAAEIRRRQESRRRRQPRPTATMHLRSPQSRRRSPTPMRNCRPPTRRPAMPPRRCRRGPTISCRPRRTTGQRQAGQDPGRRRRSAQRCRSRAARAPRRRAGLALASAEAPPRRSRPRRPAAAKAPPGTRPP